MGLNVHMGWRPPDISDKVILRTDCIECDEPILYLRNGDDSSVCMPRGPWTIYRVWKMNHFILSSSGFKFASCKDWINLDDSIEKAQKEIDNVSSS